MWNATRPTIATNALFEDIDPERLLCRLQQFGPILAGSIDLDSTAIEQNERALSEKNMAVVRGFFELGVPLGIISNASGEKRHRRVYDIAHTISESVGCEVIAVTSHELGGWQCKKPRQLLFDTVAQRMGVANHLMFHIGDQVLKDAWGANRAGYAASVHVQPCAPKSDPRGVRWLQRPLENRLLRSWDAPFGWE